MRRPIIVAATTAGALVLAVVAWRAEHYVWAGGLRTVTPHFAGTCLAIEGVPGPEDLTIDPTTGIAYISSYDRAARTAGAIFAYSVNSPTPHLVNLTPDAGDDFRPHGISLYREGVRNRKLFFVNHPGGGHSIEVFRLEGTALTHDRTLRSDALTSPNDLVAVAPEQFYVTNSRKYTDGLAGWIESSFRMSWGNVLFFDGQNFKPTASGIGFPNGINTDHHWEIIYVASSFDRSILVYRRDLETGALTRQRSIPVGTRVDNVDMDESDTLWVAARARYLGDVQPSQVLRISPDGGTPEVEELYVNLGDELANASVAATYGRHLLIGSSRGSRFLHCVMDWETVDQSARSYDHVPAEPSGHFDDHDH